MIVKWGNKYLSFLFLSFLLLITGCATQADFIDLKLNFDNLATQQKRINNELGIIKKKVYEEQPKTDDKADLLSKIDELENGIKQIEGRFEENDHTISEINQRSDKHENNISDLRNKIKSLEEKYNGIEKSVQSLTKLQSSKQETRPEIESTGEKIILPGKETGKNITSLEAYNLAYDDYLKGNYDLSIISFQDFITHFQNSSLVPNAYYWVGESFYNKKDFRKAIDTYDKLIHTFPNNDKIAVALLKTGLSYQELNDIPNTKIYLKRVIEEFPLTNEARIAKNRLAEIK